MTTNPSTPEPARDGGGAVAADRRLPDSIERALCDVFSAVLNNTQYEVACRKVADAAGPLRDAILYELRAAPPAAVGRGEAAWPVGSLIRLGDDPFGRGERAVWYRSEDGSECYVWLQHLSLAQRARIGVPDAAPAGGDVAASQPAPSSAQVGSSGGDVAAAVVTLEECAREEGACGGSSRTYTATDQARQAVLAAHEAAVRAVEAERDEAMARLDDVMRPLIARDAELTAEWAGWSLAERVEFVLGYTSHARKGAYKSQWEAERARAEALGAALLRYGVHANDCTSRLRGPDSCDCGWPETRKKCEAATRAAESAGGGE